MPMVPPPANARAMEPEFARRIRNYIRGDAWKNVLDAARSDMGCDGLSALAIAGIAGLSNEDYRFAQDLNWCVARKDIELNNVVTYDYAGGNWWYVDPEPGEPQNALVIWGVVRVQLHQGEPPKVARDKAAAFAESLIAPGQGIGNPPGRVTATQVVAGQDDLYDISGRIYLR
jgi:hypothetical protein